MEINAKSFYLRPDTPPEDIVRPPREGAEPGAPMSGHMGETAAEAGLVMRRPPLTPNTCLPFEALEYAKEMGLFEPFHQACYRAFWENGADLGDIAVLKELAKRVDLDVPRMVERLTSGHYTAAVQSQFQEALQIGVQGIPSFIMGRYFFSGAQPYPLFKQVAERVLREEADLGTPPGETPPQ